MTTTMPETTCTIDGFGPLPLVRPGSWADAGELVRQAAANSSAIYPLGGQTKACLGTPPTRPGTALDLRGLDQVIDFPARDMTITVQAGITMLALQEILARENLRLPIDVAQPHRATLGGVLATDTSGARRHGYGTLRDYVIGISALNDEGREFKAGGRVVKNVAGYDLCKLLVGSLGTLGIITQATLKLRPCAEQQALVAISCASDRIEDILTRLHATQTRPVCVELLNEPAAQAVYSSAGLVVPAGPWVLIVGYDGNEDAVAWQVQQLIKEIGTNCCIAARVDFTTRPLWDGLADFAAWPGAECVFKANILPSALASYCLRADADGPRPALRAHAGNGIVYGAWQAGLTMADASRMLTSWRERASAGQGGVIVPVCPSVWKASLAVWGPPPGSAAVMRAIKRNFDPRGIFNPGRFVAGI